MKYTRLFRVADLLCRPEDNSHHVFLCSVWGDYFRVAIDKYDNGNWSAIWSRGMLIEVPLILVTEGGKGDRSLVPDWSSFGEGAAVELELPDPYTAVKHLWGKTAAEQYLPPDTPPASVLQAIFEDTPLKRQRRASKANIQKPDAATRTPTDREQDGGQKTLFD